MTAQVVVPLLVVAALFIALLIATARLRKNGYTRSDGRVIARCRAGHLFTTVWIPFVSFKAVRLGPWRYQFCPVGSHWTLVELVDPASLTDVERRAAENHPDSPIP